MTRGDAMNGVTTISDGFVPLTLSSFTFAKFHHRLSQGWPLVADFFFTCLPHLPHLSVDACTLHTFLHNFRLHSPHHYATIIYSDLEDSLPTLQRLFFHMRMVSQPRKRQRTGQAVGDDKPSLLLSDNRTAWLVRSAFPLTLSSVVTLNPAVPQPQ